MRRILRKIAAGEEDSIGDVSTLADPSVRESKCACFMDVLCLLMLLLCKKECVGVACASLEQYICKRTVWYFESSVADEIFSLCFLNRL